MTTTALVGATGLVGSNILSALLTHSNVSTVSAFARRNLDCDDPHSRLRPVVDSNSSNWPAEFCSFRPPPRVFYSALGTTRALAGGLANQRKIDYDLNLDLAKAAKEEGVEVYVLISSAGVSKKSLMGYSKMKAELEEAVSSLGFKKTVIIKPGLLCGHRNDLRMAEYILRVIADFAGRISGGHLKNFWAQDADVVARAAVVAGLKCADGTAPEGGMWLVNQADIVRMGKTEQK